MAEWKHGTRGTYVNGCRCEECRKANAAYLRKRYHANLLTERRYCREKARRYARHGQIGSVDLGLIHRAQSYAAAARDAVGELADLVAEQQRQDRPYEHRPRHICPDFAIEGLEG